MFKISPKITKIDPKILKVRQNDQKTWVSYCKIPIQEKKVQDLPSKPYCWSPNLSGSSCLATATIFSPVNHPPPHTTKKNQVLSSLKFLFQVNTYIQYQRLNHQDFTFHVKIKNPSRQTKKVIIRIHLGLSDEG